MACGCACTCVARQVGSCALALAIAICMRFVNAFNVIWKLCTICRAQ